MAKKPNKAFNADAKPKAKAKTKGKAKKTTKAAKAKKPAASQENHFTDLERKLNPSRSRETVAERRNRLRGSNDDFLQRKLGIDTSKLDMDNYSYRWVDDLPGRVSDFQQRDWKIVENSFDERSKGVGNDIRRSNGARDMILMCIPKDFYEDDQRHKAREVREVEKQIETGNLKDAPAASYDTGRNTLTTQENP